MPSLKKLLDNFFDDNFWECFLSFIHYIFSSDPILKSLFWHQCCFNIVDQRWNNLDPTLKIKENPTSDFQLCTTLMQRQCPTLKQHWINVAQRGYCGFWTLLNVVSTLFHRGLNVSSSYIKTTMANGAIAQWLRRWISSPGVPCS